MLQSSERPTINSAPNSPGKNATRLWALPIPRSSTALLFSLCSCNDLVRKGRGEVRRAIQSDVRRAASLRQTGGRRWLTGRRRKSFPWLRQRQKEDEEEEEEEEEGRNVPNIATSKKWKKKGRLSLLPGRNVEGGRGSRSRKEEGKHSQQREKEGRPRLIIITASNPNVGGE